MPKNILIIGHSNIGDVCYDAVVIAPLRENFPQARISFLTSSRSSSILENYTGLDRIISFDKQAKDKGFFGLLRLINLLRKEHFDLVIVLKRSLLDKFLGVRIVWRMQKAKKHAVQRHLELLGSKGLVVENAIFNFVIKEEENNSVRSFLDKEAIAESDKVIGILPIAAWSLKSWPVASWNELAKKLRQQYGIKTIALGRSQDDPFGRLVLENLSGEIIRAIDKTSLKEALALIKRCDIFIAPDSSLLHLASCLGVTVIGLYGPTSSEYFYPYLHKQNIIISNKKLECMPCCPGLKVIPCKKEFQPGQCMKGISVDEVLEKIKEIKGYDKR